MKKNPSAPLMPKHEAKPKLTDADRHKRFVDMAKEIGASEDSADFDLAFEKVASMPSDRHSRRSGKRASS